TRVGLARPLQKRSPLYGLCLASAARGANVNSFSDKQRSGPGVCPEAVSDQECGLPWSPLFTSVNQSGHPARCGLARSLASTRDLRMTRKEGIGGQRSILDISGVDPTLFRCCRVAYL